MLTKSYEVDADGRWRRRLDDFVEDLVVVCPACGAEPAGRLETDDGGFAFTPEPDGGAEDHGERPEDGQRRNGSGPDR